MPTTPKGQTPSTDVIRNAVYVMLIVAGENKEAAVPNNGKDRAAQALDATRAQSMTIELIF